MADDNRLFALTQALSDPIRLGVLQHLMAGAATVSELVSVTGTTQPNLSNHLLVLRQRGLVRGVKQGRHMLYEIKDPTVAQLIETLTVLAGGGPKPATKPSEVMKARTCYDHLAGQLGVRIFDALLARDAITAPQELRTTSSAGSAIMLGPAGPEVFGGFGIDVGGFLKLRRQYGFACRDWTERRPHLGGKLGAALWARAIEAGWIMRHPSSRAVLVTPSGREVFAQRLGIALEG